MHYAQTVVGGLAILWCFWTQSWLILFGVLIGIFLWALAAHLLVEGNKPAAAEHPFWWSIVNDVRMFLHFATGTLGTELDKAGVTRRHSAE